MNYSTNEIEKAREIAFELKQKGYDVFIDPDSRNIPFFLDGYTPDLVAIKNDGGIVVEIKSSIKRLPLSKFHRISEIISSNQGWHFSLVTLDDPISSLFASLDNQLPNISLLKERFENIDKLISMDMKSPALMELWSLVESCLRLIAKKINMPVEFLQPNRLINHLYSIGELSMEQYDLLKKLMNIRNKVAHGFNQDINIENLKHGLNLLQYLIIKVELAACVRGVSLKCKYRFIS